MSDNAKIILIDGSSLMFRAFFAIRNLDSFTNRSGLHTNALYGFHDMLQRVMEKERPTHGLVAFDASRTTFRTEMLADYKGGRSSMPEELKEQVPYFNKMLDAMGLKHFELVNYEADDIIGTLAERAAADGFEVVVVSGDKDLTQLAAPRIRVDITKSGVKELKTYTVESFKEEMGIAPKQLIDVKAFSGDTSDNYRGVTGVGEKTALQLVQTYGSVEGVYDHIDDMKKSKRKENLIKEKKEAFLCKSLATIMLDAPLPKELTLSHLKLESKPTTSLKQFYEQMNFSRFLRELPETTDELWVNLDERDIKETMSDQPTVVSEWLGKDHLTTLEKVKKPVLYVETLAENYHVGELVAAVVFDQETQKAYGLKKEILSEKEIVDWLKQTEVVTFDAKRLWVLANRRLGWPEIAVSMDTLLGAYILDVNSSNFDPAVTADRLGLAVIPTNDEVYGRGAKQKVPDEAVLLTHLAQKAQVISQLSEQLPERLKEKKQWDLLNTIEMPTAKVLSGMEIDGITVDPDRLNELGEDFKHRLDDLEAAIYRAAGETFNINSTKQLGEVLFDRLELPVIKKTKTGYSTAADVLDKLKGKHPIIDYILDYRMLAKLQSTYITGLKEAREKDGKIHTRYVQTLTQTGRLSSTDPNLQNIPIRTDAGRQIRRAFVPSAEDHVILSSDYSQIELRVLAHISDDQAMQEAFIHHQDIHTTTAMKVFHVATPDEVTPLQRRHAKAVNFGIVYGISDYGLSQNLGISRPEARKFIDTYLATYPQISQFMHEIVEKARETGFVETLFGRRRYLPDITSSNFNKRSFAERTAMNSPIQGTAADIIKIAMIRVAKALKEEQLETKMLLQVHDELVFDVPNNELEQVKKLVPELMASAAELKVPLVSEVAYGKTWYDAK
ncbi:MAG: DNA polymerase I [Bavariicoccus seileri]|uniref:DNA polymerase I n=1 Tax=Bavariicoccus seileri TaxID=549685 RepID=UPI003F9A4E65